MADAKISALPTGQFQSSDYIPYVDGASGITRKATKNDLRGSMGSQGSIGSQGSQGSIGATGAQGAIGNQGTQGTAGSRGSQGSQGSQGSIGATGYAVPRISASVTGGTVAPNADTTDIREITAQDQAIFFDTPSGTPVDGQKMIIQIKYAGTAGTISFTGSWTAGGVALPTSGVTGKYLHLGFMYVTANSFNKWMLLASAQQS